MKLIFLGYFCDSNNEKILSSADNFAQIGHMKCLKNLGNVKFISTNNYKEDNNNYVELVNDMKVTFIGNNKSFSKLSKFLNLYNFLKESQSDIIIYYNNLFLYNFVCLLLKKFHKKEYIPILITEPYKIKNVNVITKIKYFFQKKISFKAIKNSTGIIKITDDMVYNHKNSIVINGGIDKEILDCYKKLKKHKNKKTIITYTGAIYYRYNLDKIINVVNKLDESVEFHIYGVGDDLDHIKSLQNEKIKYMGNISRNELMQIQKDSDILVAILNTDELSKNTFPSKIFEYLATGNEVIISDLQSINHRLKKLCHIVPEITEETIEKEIKKILAGDYRNNLENANKILNDFYTWEANSKKINKFIKEVVK